MVVVKRVGGGYKRTTQGAIAVAKESSLGGSNGGGGKGYGKNNTDSG